MAQCKMTIAMRYPDGITAGARCPNDAEALGLCKEHLDRDLSHAEMVRDEATAEVTKIKDARKK